MICIKRENKKDDVIYFDEIVFDSQYVLLEEKTKKNKLYIVNDDTIIIDLFSGYIFGCFSEETLDEYNCYVYDNMKDYVKKIIELLNKLDL